MKTRLIAVALASALTITGAHAQKITTDIPAAPGASVRVLGDDFELLAASFNAASSRVRFLAILSPT